ncbi:hypothetical protein KSD_01100 [Ktedonobacter sp. SOSP1-85]|nr:hypothetical protein KSD_01100 [Ktedonobacter sp. SOSP1-85]
MDRQRRAANPERYDEKGRLKKQGPKKLRWKQSKRYQATRRRKASKERKLAAHRKSLHGRKVHEVLALGVNFGIPWLSCESGELRPCPPGEAFLKELGPAPAYGGSENWLFHIPAF